MLLPNTPPNLTCINMMRTNQYNNHCPPHKLGIPVQQSPWILIILMTPNTSSPINAQCFKQSNKPKKSSQTWELCIIVTGYIHMYLTCILHLIFFLFILFAFKKIQFFLNFSTPV